MGSKPAIGLVPSGVVLPSNKGSDILRTMKIVRTSMVSGITRTLDLDVTEEQLALFSLGRVAIQDCFPNLSADEREFIKTGLTAEEWSHSLGMGYTLY